MQSKLLVCMTLGLACCWADVTSIREMYRAILSHSAEGSLPKPEEFFQKVNEETVGALSAPDVASLLPLAKQCLQSPRAEVRQDGLLLFMAVVLRADSGKLLEAYIDDLGTLSRGPKGAQSLRHGALYILGSTKPTILPGAIRHLAANLEDEGNTVSEALTIAASLLEASPSDTVMIQRVLVYVSRRADAGLTGGVLRQIGLLGTRNQEALAFIGTSLNDQSVFVREAAIDAASRVDRDVRAAFSDQLTRIAVDRNEPERIRSAAQAALVK